MPDKAAMTGTWYLDVYNCIYIYYIYIYIEMVGGKLYAHPSVLMSNVFVDTT